MGEHLPVVFAGLLAVDDVDLVEPPTELGEVVELCESRKGDEGVSAPQLGWGGGVGDSTEDELGGVSGA
jgi:hypothetical protein